MSADILAGSIVIATLVGVLGIVWRVIYNASRATVTGDPFYWVMEGRDRRRRCHGPSCSRPVREVGPGARQSRDGAVLK